MNYNGFFSPKLSPTIADSTNWLWKWTKLLCFMLNKPWPCTLFCSTCEPECFYWFIVVHMHFNNFCVLCSVNAKKKDVRTKTYNKKAGEFRNQFVLVNVFKRQVLLALQPVVLFFTPSSTRCTVEPWLYHLGFSMAYGSLALKTWR